MLKNTLKILIQYEKDYISLTAFFGLWEWQANQKKKKTYQRTPSKWIMLLDSDWLEEHKTYVYESNIIN